MFVSRMTFRGLDTYLGKDPPPPPGASKSRPAGRQVLAVQILVGLGSRGFKALCSPLWLTRSRQFEGRFGTGIWKQVSDVLSVQLWMLRGFLESRIPLN